MMKITKLETLDQFQNLKEGQKILVKWGEAPYKSKQIMFYEIPMTQHQENEIICNKKQNVYFNYKMHLGLDREGICTSNAKEVYLIEDGEN